VIQFMVHHHSTYFRTSKQPSVVLVLKRVHDVTLGWVRKVRLRQGMACWHAFKPQQFVTCRSWGLVGCDWQ
jgi:hypothetical protein